MSKNIIRTLWTKSRKRRNRLRSWGWSLLCAQYGHDSHVRGRITVYSPQNLYIGSKSSINEGVVLNARGRLEVGDHVHISPGVIINTGGLHYEQRKDERTHLAQPVFIKDGVWIGSGAIINPGVTLGKHCVIGAGAVVTKDVPANTVTAGVPARVIKEIPTL